VADLVLRNHCEIHVLLNDHLSGFTTSWILSDGYKYCGSGLALADMNGDDAIDILAGQQPGGGGRIGLFTNAGNGTAFTLTWQSPLYGEPNVGTMKNLVSANLNNDAAPDIVASEILPCRAGHFYRRWNGCNFYSSHVERCRRAHVQHGGREPERRCADRCGPQHRRRGAGLYGQGSGTLSETWSTSDVGVGFAQLLADFDCDGYDDVFSSSYSPGQAYVYLNRPLSGTFQLVWSDQLHGEIYSGSAADLDEDDHLDLIVGEDSVLHIYRSVFPKHHFYLPILLCN